MAYVDEFGVVVLNRGDMVGRVRNANERIGQRQDLRRGVARDRVLVEPEAGIDAQEREAPVFNARKRESAAFDDELSFPM